MSPISTSPACLAVNASSPTAASPAHILYALIKVIPTCIAIQRLVPGPSSVLVTMVGMCTACQEVLPIAALTCFAWSDGNSLSMLIRTVYLLHPEGFGHQ